jgi:AraC family transcriptional regulator
VLRAQPIPVKVTERILPIHYTSVSNGVLIHPVFIYKPQINVIGKKTYIDVRRNRWDLTEDEKRKELLFNNINEVYQCLKQEVFIGLTRWDANKADCKNYLSASEAVSSEVIPRGYWVDTIPASNYAVFKYIGLFHIKQLNQSQLEELWEFILFVWMSKTNFHIADSYHFEIIDMGEVKDDYFEINLYIPIS